MATTEVDVRNDVMEELAERPPLTTRMVRFVRKQPLGTFGLLIVLMFVIAALFAPQIAPFDPEENNFEVMFAPPGLTHLLGADEFGRDIFSRIVYGARTAMLIGFVCAFAAAFAGLIVGVTLSLIHI